MAELLSQDAKTRRGSADAGPYFREMMDFVGFTPEDAQAIKDSGLVIEKYIPAIVADFYTHLLHYPPTRVHFLDDKGDINQPYLQKRMHHLTNFWRRTAVGEYDDEYARYVDYVGLAHTRQGADPNIYIAERYVIGQVGFMQRSITSALTKELRAVDPDLEARAVRAWNMLMMVILQMLARVYSEAQESEHSGAPRLVNIQTVQDLAVKTYELGLGLGKPPTYKEVKVAEEDEIPDGQRKLVQVQDISIGIFHYKGEYYALRNLCLHAGGPVCTGKLEGDTLTCPWHGYQYRLTDGRLLVDETMHLEMYPLRIAGGEIFITVPETLVESAGPFFLEPEPQPEPSAGSAMQENEFSVDDIPEGGKRRLHLNGKAVAVFHVGGQFYAVDDACTHAGGPLSEGYLSGMEIECPWHGSCFNIATGAVTCPPAVDPVETYKVEIQGALGRVLPK